MPRRNDIDKAIRQGLIENDVIGEDAREFYEYLWTAVYSDATENLMQSDYLPYNFEYFRVYLDREDFRGVLETIFSHPQT